MGEFAPADPGFADRVRASFGRQRFMGTIGARLIRIEPGLVEVELPWREDLTQQHGFLHGGVTAALADVAGGYAAYSLFPADASVLTVEFKLNLLAPAGKDTMRATGRVVRSGRTLTVCQLAVATVQGPRTTDCAIGTQTLICLPGRANGPPPG